MVHEEGRCHQTEERTNKRSMILYKEISLTDPQWSLLFS